MRHADLLREATAGIAKPASAPCMTSIYETNAVFSQFLGSASMTFFFFFPFLASSSCLAFSCFSCLFFSFFFLFRLLFSLSSLFFPFLSLLICSLFLFSN